MIAPTEIIIRRVHIQRISCDKCNGYSSSLPDRTLKKAMKEWREDGWVINKKYTTCPRCSKKGAYKTRRKN